MKRFLSIALSIAMVFSLLSGVAGVRAADLSMHITSPVAGATIASSTFTVSGTFDAAQTQGMKLIVTLAGLGTHMYTFTASGTTWSVAVGKADFSGFVDGTAYATTLQGAQQMPNIPPVQTDPISITWRTVQYITIDPATVVGPVGSTVLFTVTGHYNLAPTEAPVAASFTATAGTMAGNVLTIANSGTVTASFGGVSPVSATVTVTAVPPVRTLQSIAITPNPANIQIGGTQQFVATGNYNIAPLTAVITSSVTWSANAPAGLFTGTAIGSFGVTATLGTVSGSAIVNVTAVPGRTLLSIAITPLTATIPIGGTQQFVATGTYNIAPLTAVITSSVTWSANAPAGLFTGTAVGSFAVTATSGSIAGFAIVNVTTLLPPVVAGSASLTDTAKVLTLNYYNPVPLPPAPGIPVALASQYVYKMGDVIHGTVTFADVVAGNSYTVVLRRIDGSIVDTVTGYQVAGILTYPFQIGTANVSHDGPFDVVVADANETFVAHRVFIQYNLTWKTSTINACAGFNTIEGWITRGNGQTVLVPVTVGITYPDNTLAATYVVAAMSSGQFSLTFPVNPATQIGQYRVFIRDGYADGITFLPAPVNRIEPLTIPDNDAMIYTLLGNIPAALSITAATYGSPILLYKNQINQPVVISLMDQNGNPVTGAAWTVKELTTTITTYTVTEISPGYYRFVLKLGAGPDVRFTAAKTMFATATTSNTVVVALRDLGAFNPYLDINAYPCYTVAGGLYQGTVADGLYQACGFFDPLTGRRICDTLPCTIGSSLWLNVGYWDVPASMAANWAIDDASVVVTVNGPVRKLATGHYIIEKAGKITASISMNVWERQDPNCPFYNLDGTVDLTNACCHTYTKSFDVCEVLSCTTVSVTVDGTNITDAANITVGKSSDLVVNVSGANAPAGLFCGCNAKIVKIYMVDALGNIIPDAFTAKTWGGVNKDLTELWYNGIPDSVGKYSGPNPLLLGSCNVLFKQGSDVTNGVNVIDNCEKLTFKDITFNNATGTGCGNHLVVEVFGLYRAFDACGLMGVTYPFVSETVSYINVNPVPTTLSATATVYEMGLDPTDILAGVPSTIEITDPKFSTATGVQGIVWSATLGGTKLSDLGITMTASPLDTGYKFTFSCAFPEAGDLVITGYQYNADCTVKEVVTITLKVVMPTFDVKLGLLDGSTIANDHIITEGFGELIYVTATDPRADGHHDFSTDPNWTLSAVAVDNACGLPTSKVCYLVPAGCTTPSPIQVYGYDNPHITDAPQFELYFVVNGCANLLVDTFTFASSLVSVSPTEVPFTIPASATHVVFSVKDAHAHGGPGVSVAIAGTYNGVGASGYTFMAGAATTDKNGEADWAFVPPYSGVYTVSAGFTTLCTLPCSWSDLSTSATITASYKASVIDTTAPVVTLTAGIDGSKVSSATLNLTGKVTDNVGVTQLFVGFNKVDVLPDGSFMTPLTLVEGENTITVVAYDAAGNKGTVTAKVTYTAPVSTKTVLLLTIGSDIASVNGKATSVDAAPEIVEDRTFVPIRFIAESFGATVEWLPETQGITITLGDHTIGLQIDNATAVIDGTIVSLAAAPYIKNGRTMVPLRVISEAFGGDVVWDPALRTITIGYQP